MADKVSRRGFLKKSVLASTGAALALSFEERALLARATTKPVAAVPQGSVGGLPTGKIGKLKISRLICGGNLISSFAHSRDLIYVSTLLKHYFTNEKVFETLQLCEERGINTAILRLDEHMLRLLATYRNERGGQIQWIAQVKPKPENLVTDIEKAIDNGAVGVYVQGGVGDSFVQEGRVDLLGKAVETIRRNGAIAGLGAHALETTVACEEAKLNPDFYMKTLNSKNYWSAGPKERHDSVWAETPKETIEFMKGVERPWIAFKVLAAGAIHPRGGFQYVFDNGADFACVGMFDFQVVEDVVIAKDVLAKTRRQRPWRG